MKKLITLSLLFCLVTNSYATIRRVNNNAGVQPVAGLVYTTITAAVSDAVAGDTIYIEPTINSYDFTVNITKRLVFIGNGYNITSNAGLVTPLPFNPNECRVGNWVFSAGSENSVIMGMVFGNPITCNVGSLVFRRCNIATGINLNSSNNLIEQCFVIVIGGNNSGNNNIIRNCIVSGTPSSGISGQNSALIDQCYFNMVYSSLTNCTFTNCIVKEIQAGLSTNNTFTNCLKTIHNGVGTFPTAGINNNIENVNFATVFIVATPSNTKDSDYRLSPTSPAIGTGTSGQDMGAFSGAFPYRLSGEAAIPVITNFRLSTVGSTSSGLVGSITIQSNN